MRNILLTISYDGTDFCGWQRQDFADRGRAVRTVQQTVEGEKKADADPEILRQIRDMAQALECV